MTSQTTRPLLPASGQEKQKPSMAASLALLTVLLYSISGLNRAHNFVINYVQRGNCI
jgi:hypothetical protein